MKNRFNLINEEDKIYSDAVLSGNTLYLSGIASFDSKGNFIGCKDARKQTEQIMNNMIQILDEFGMNLSSVIKLTVFLKNISDRENVAEVRKNYFGNNKPASTLIGVSEFGHPEMIVEIEAIAVKQD